MSKNGDLRGFSPYRMKTGLNILRVSDWTAVLKLVLRSRYFVPLIKQITFYDSSSGNLNLDFRTVILIYLKEKNIILEKVSFDFDF